MENKPKPVFAKRIFWDVNFENIDYDLRKNWIIERVFERGDIEDIRNCRRYYGDDTVKEALVNAKWLSFETLVFVSNLFFIDRKEFKCYTQILLNQNALRY